MPFFYFSTLFFPPAFSMLFRCSFGVLFWVVLLVLFWGGLLDCSFSTTSFCLYSALGVLFGYSFGVFFGCTLVVFFGMGWLRLVGSIKLQVSFVEYSLFYRALLQKRPVILSILLTEFTPYVTRHAAIHLLFVQRPRCVVVVFS